ncbi:hypothetical protein ACSSZE_00710 [Acidithiobacillus caldus]
MKIRIPSIPALWASALFTLCLMSLFSPWVAAQAEPYKDADESFWQALEHTHYIAEGERGPVVYLFMDPNCPYCHELFSWLQNPVAARQLRLRVVLVGYLTASSAAKAASILAAKDPLQALKANEDGFAIRDGKPEGAAPLANAATLAKMRPILDRNYNFLQGKESLLPELASAGEASATVPFLVYRQKGVVHYVIGLPSHRQWKALTGSN